MSFTETTYQVLNSVTRSRRHFIILLLGFSSGLPASLTASTLQAWFTESGINLHTIGAVTLLVLPYSLRFLWAPLFDHFKIPGLDRRCGWLFLIQFGLIASIISMAFASPQQMTIFHGWTFPWLMIPGFITAFLSASQDVVISAYQTEVLPHEEKGLGASIYVTGWRIGVILSGSIALILASQYGWQQTYLIMAAFMLVGVVATYLAPRVETTVMASKNLFQATIQPFAEFFQRHGFKTALIFLLLILTYKAGDALALALNTTFLLRHMGYSLAIVGLVNKTVSIIAALAGGVVAGILMTRISLYRALIIFGLIQGVANLGYAVMAYWGKSIFLLVFTAFLENFTSGMGTIALLALIMELCNLRYTATQFALLSAIAFIARTFVGPISASMVESLGWLQFFIWCFIISLPTLFFVYLSKENILQIKQTQR